MANLTERDTVHTVSPEDCLRLDSPLASKTALERRSNLKNDTCIDI